MRPRGPERGGCVGTRTEGSTAFQGLSTGKATPGSTRKPLSLQTRLFGSAQFRSKCILLLQEIKGRGLLTSPQSRTQTVSRLCAGVRELMNQMCTLPENPALTGGHGKLWQKL